MVSVLILLQRWSREFFLIEHCIFLYKRSEILILVIAECFGKCRCNSIILRVNNVTCYLMMYSEY